VPARRPARTWGAGTPPTETIVAAAIRIIDTDGLDALTTRRLAGELDMFQPNLYRRVADRNQLLDLVTEAIMDEVGTPDVAESDWRGWLTDCGLRVWRTWQRHPNAAPLLQHGGAYPATLRLVEKILAVFLDGQIDPAAAPAALQAYLGYVFGTTVLDALGHTGHGKGKPVQLTPEQASRYPHVVAGQRLFADTGRHDDADRIFVDGLALVLDAIASHRQSAAARSTRARGHQ
jgi:AcrR family transcriptional regulator